jgi:hypothetical protein
MSDKTENEEKLTPCPNCGSRISADRETEKYVLEDGTKRRMTFCTACVREKADGAIRYEVISEEFIRTEIDRKMSDG